MNITKEDFEAYLEIQYSGITNMFDVKRVQQLSGLSKGQCMEIMKNYFKYKSEFEVEK